MAAIGFMVGFILFQYRTARATCLLLLAWCILGGGWTMAVLSVGALCGIASELLADEGPKEARS